VQSQRYRSEPTLYSDAQVQFDQKSLPIYVAEQSSYFESCGGSELMIQWFTSTIYTVTIDEVSLQTAQKIILKEALRHRFLLHGILSLSAIHLADKSDENQKYSTIALTHHKRALALFESERKNINASNLSASIGFSSIAIMFAFASCRPTEPVKRNSLIDDLARIFQLAKDWHKMAQALTKEGGEKEVILPHEKSHETSDDTSRALDRLYEFNKQSSRSDVSNETAIYKSAIECLKSTFMMLDENKLNPHLVCAWPEMIPQRFFELLKRHEKLALIIVAHYCIVLHRLRSSWWLRGWGQGVLEAICEHMDSASQEMLRWPKKMVGLEEVA
jgi:hypothetical protein